VYTPNTKEMCATGAYMRMLQHAVALAPLAGHPEQAAGFQARFDAAVPHFNAYYALNLANGTYGDGVEQTLAVIPLALRIVPAEHLAAVQQWLIHDVETTRALHLTTGATGTRFFFEVLSAMGRTDLAAVIAAQDTLPSHGFWVTQGATTCWEVSNARARVRLKRTLSLIRRHPRTLTLTDTRTGAAKSAGTTLRLLRTTTSSCARTSAGSSTRCSASRGRRRLRARRPSRSWRWRRRSSTACPPCRARSRACAAAWRSRGPGLARPWPRSSR
jgi:hypothetical protein